MYESYFQLREKPFDIVPNPAYLYLSRTHKQAITYLRYGLQERLGFVLMTGGVGSGKTLLVRELIRTLSPEITLARIFNTRVSSEELIAMINEDFGLNTAGKGKVLMLKDLYAHLLQEYAEGRRPVLIVDEAQNLSLDLLEDVRMLSNLETNDAKLLQIMLIGQSELGRVLSHAEMRQFRQRISISCHLHALTRPETEEYILHRLGVAGNRDALSFHDGALDAIYSATGGIPRQINTLCNFLLLTAYTEEQRDVTAEMVQDVAAGIGLALDAGTDEHVEKPVQERNRHAHGDVTGRRALLRALGVMLQDEDNGMDRAGDGGTTDGREYPTAIRSIGLRLMAMEKEIAHLEQDDYAALRQRLDTIESQVKGVKHERTSPHKDTSGTAGLHPYCDVPERTDRGEKARLGPHES